VAADEAGNLVDHDGGVEHTVTKETETAWSLYQVKADHVIESRLRELVGRLRSFPPSSGPLSHVAAIFLYVNGVIGALNC
jgi:hypothetical protein